MNNTKIGRNDMCPCGSGLKYKKCCLGKSQEQLAFESYIDAQKKADRAGRIKECFYPNHDECEGKIAKSHAIQNNRVLTALAENGEVILMNSISPFGFQSEQIKGRRIATTFTGFCSYHDKVLFQDIEDHEFIHISSIIYFLSIIHNARFTFSSSGIVSEYSFDVVRENLMWCGIIAVLHQKPGRLHRSYHSLQ